MKKNLAIRLNLQDRPLLDKGADESISIQQEHKAWYHRITTFFGFGCDEWQVTEITPEFGDRTNGPLILRSIQEILVQYGRSKTLILDLSSIAMLGGVQFSVNLIEARRAG